MKAANPRREKKQVTRQAVKEAALACFAKSGWEKTSVGSIARAAGVAHGTFYVHFPTKEVLADELLADFNAGLEKRLRPVWEETSGGSIEARVRRTAAAFLDHWQAERGFVRAYAQRLGGALRIEALRDGINPPATRLVTALLDGLAGAGTGCAARTNLVAQGLLAMWLRIGLQILFGPKVGRDEAVDTLTKMTLGAVTAVTASPSRVRPRRRVKSK